DCRVCGLCEIVPVRAAASDDGSDAVVACIWRSLGARGQRLGGAGVSSGQDASVAWRLGAMSPPRHLGRRVESPVDRGGDRCSVADAGWFGGGDDGVCGGLQRKPVSGCGRYGASARHMGRYHAGREHPGACRFRRLVWAGGAPMGDGVCSRPPVPRAGSCDGQPASELTGKASGMTSREQVRASTSDLRRDPLAVVVAAAMLVTSLGFAAVDAIDRESVELLAVVSLLGAVILVIRCLAVFGRATDLGLLVLLVGSVFWFYAPALSVAFSYEQWYQQAAHLIIDNRHALKAFVAVNLFVFMVTVGYCFGGSWALSRRLVAIVGRDEWPAQRRLIALMFTGAFGALLFYVGFSGGVGDAVEYILGSRTVKKPW